MRKIVFLTFLGLMAASSSSVVLAEDELVPPINPGRTVLVDTDVSTLKSKVNDLERRLNDVERSRRFSEDRVRQLERDINDIRRRVRSLP